VELTLNLPAGDASCACEAAPAEDRTFLERGVETLAEGEYVEAVQYFQRYRRLGRRRRRRGAATEAQGDKKTARDDATNAGRTRNRPAA
jgi:hypothetical protein